MTTEEHVKLQLDEYVKEHREVCHEIARLLTGDSNGMVDIGDYSGSAIPQGQDRIDKMVQDRLACLSDLESRLDEYCRISDVKNPIPKARRLV